MSIFDKIRNAASNADPSAAPALNDTEKKSETFTFASLPESLEQLKALPEAFLDSPFKTAALTVCALCAYAAVPEIGAEMLNFLKGPQPLSPYEKQFLADRFRDSKLVPFSYFKGAVPANDYTPDEPFTITLETNPYSFTENGYATLWLTSGGADSPRQIKLRSKGDKWYLWEQFLLAGIRSPKSQDPWA